MLQMPPLEAARTGHHAAYVSQHPPRQLLSPQDAFAHSPPRKQPPTVHSGKNPIPNGSEANLVPHAGSTRSVQRRAEKERGRSGSRKKVAWKKLLWVRKQHHTYPDNYTDEETFLDHLQRNPRLQPYDFWPLVADSTVIVQHVCSVIIFVCCFAGIFQERVSPVSVVSWGSVSTVLGWGIWDWWEGQREAVASSSELSPDSIDDGSSASSTSSSFNPGSQTRDNQPLHGLGLTIPGSSTGPRHAHSGSGTSVRSTNSTTSPVTPGQSGGGASFAAYSYYPPPKGSQALFSPRNQQRLATAKSAVLIYCTLLGLSPILKSLTKSTTSDSIWAMSCWLMCINVFFFDYGGGVGAKFPASLSTNAALMASTVLASRLPSTTHVFSITLFSIEVFGLFPVFRRHLRHMSWHGHVAVTVFLVMGAGGGVGIVSSGGGWKAAIAGMFLGCFLTGLAMGMCSWWLIGLQKYKNEIHGPWDPARPILRRHWD
ncbi:MAG: hypothetical protein M1833_003141 [Piccolia ochrophora]|nr:MAG: hypothetical protein M1833_003141 [Piccolia ochrophora]